MSINYLFYIGYEDKGGDIHPYGPYNKFGELEPVYKRSRNFCKIHTEFYRKINIHLASSDLKKIFINEDGEYQEFIDIYYMYLDEMPSTNFQKSGYFKYNEILDYLKDDLDMDNFTSYYSSDEYSLLLKKATETEDKDALTKLKEYTYITFPDTTSKEYDSFSIQSIIKNGGFDDFLMEYSIKRVVNKDNDPAKTCFEYGRTVIIMRVY
jgi:hypothetical protein